jgi:photosystem II stability/assembly factor-like uncharacterized protein
MMILLSAGGDNSVRHAAPSDSLLVGTADGVWRLDRAANGDWSVGHRALQGCFVSALTKLEDGALIAGIHGVGFARSDDGGTRWRWTNAGLTQFDVWCVRAWRLDGRELVFGGTMPAHLFVSEDGGGHWSELDALTRAKSAPKWFFPPAPRLGHVKDIVVQNGRDLLVGIEVGALLRSRDQGGSFADLPIDPDPSEVDLHRIAVHPDRPDRIICSSGFGMFTSEDGGATWARGTLPEIDYPDALVLHPDEPDTLFVAGAVGWPPHWYKLGRSRTKIARSRDGGRTWERLLGGLPDGQRAIFGGMTIEAWDGGYAVFAADTDGQLFESRDGGDSWHMIAEVGPVSKGDFHLTLARDRKPLAHLDDMHFEETGTGRLAAAGARLGQG